ncbi:MAG: acyl-CoA reductase [Bacteroidetes bacterium]|nr:acyl-CoA reductase [Bacteroidota bacterium]
MLNREERIAAFVSLGEAFGRIANGNAVSAAETDFQEMIPGYHLSNGWYTPAFIRHRLQQMAAGLGKEVLENWLGNYTFPASLHDKNVAVILAGNLPMVGFDDFAAVLLAGAKFCGKLSSDDKRMMPAIGALLTEIEPRFEGQFVFTDFRLPKIDAVIATGSNNSSRYFDYYFGKYPHIIRKNRHSVAVLTGNETREALTALGDDVFIYFGLGCRSVSKLFVPEGYSFNTFYESILHWGETMTGHKKYMNNYEYHRTLYLLSRETLLDNNFLLLKEDAALSSPPGMLFWESYSSPEALQTRLQSLQPELQCVAGSAQLWPGALPFGQTQCPGPADYADGVDTLAFLCSL